MMWYHKQDSDSSSQELLGGTKSYSLNKVVKISHEVFYPVVKTSVKESFLIKENV